MFDDDVFVGTRIAVNDAKDSQALVGALIDRNHGATAIRIEAERRLSERFKHEVESRLFLRTGHDDVLRFFARDNFAVVRIVSKNTDEPRTLANRGVSDRRVSALIGEAS